LRQAVTAADTTSPANRRVVAPARRIVGPAARCAAATAPRTFKSRPRVPDRRLPGRLRRTNTMPSPTAARTAATPPKSSGLQTEGFWRTSSAGFLCCAARLGWTPESDGCRRAQTRYEVPCDRSQRANSARFANVWLSHTIPSAGLLDPGRTRTPVSKVAIASTTIAGRTSAAAKSLTPLQVSHRAARVPRRKRPPPSPLLRPRFGESLPGFRQVLR
jgi:hypothetical protein